MISLTFDVFRRQKLIYWRLSPCVIENNKMNTMKKLILLLAAAAFLGCSSEDSEEEEKSMCCHYSKAEIVEIFKDQYQAVIEHENASAEQIDTATREYEQALEDPCASFKIYLERMGASCENPF